MCLNCVLCGVLTDVLSSVQTPAAAATITPMLQLDSSVCELLLCGQTLLASTLGFCYLCNIQVDAYSSSVKNRTHTYTHTHTQYTHIQSSALVYDLTTSHAIEVPEK